MAGIGININNPFGFVGDIFDNVFYSGEEKDQTELQQNYLDQQFGLQQQQLLLESSNDENWFAKNWIYIFIPIFILVIIFIIIYIIRLK